MRRQLLVSLGLALACTACSSDTGSSSHTGGSGGGFDDYCALVDLPATKPADLERLQQRSAAAAAAHRGKAVSDAASHPGIVRAALELDLAIAPALLEMRSSLEDAPPSGPVPTLAALARARDALRAACARR